MKHDFSNERYEYIGNATYKYLGPDTIGWYGGQCKGATVRWTPSGLSSFAWTLELDEFEIAVREARKQAGLDKRK